MSKLSRPLILGLLVLATSGCTRTWGLKVTEVGKRAVELYMAEPSTNSPSLTNWRLKWEGDGGHGSSVRLSTLGRDLNGGEFLVIWEDGSYSGAPVAQPYTQGQLPSVPGIKVAAGFFDQIDNVPSAVRVHGSRTNIFLGTHEVDDLVRFGQPLGDRPDIGGSFNDNGSLGSPSGSSSLQRKWNGGPKDVDGEGDWKGPLFTNFGQPTPP